MRNLATSFAVIAFLLVLGLVYWFTDNHLQTQMNPNRNVKSTSGGTITLQVAMDGHYRISGMLNRQPVVFLLDTGATRVAIGQKMAQDLGISRGAPVSVFTANGQITGYQTQIDSLEFAGVQFRHVSALIMPQMEDEVLLGMSILKKFHWQQQDGTLTLTLID